MKWCSTHHRDSITSGFAGSHWRGPASYPGWEAQGWGKTSPPRTPLSSLARARWHRANSRQAIPAEPGLALPWGRGGVRAAPTGDFRLHLTFPDRLLCNEHLDPSWVSGHQPQNLLQTQGKPRRPHSGRPGTRGPADLQACAPVCGKWERLLAGGSHQSETGCGAFAEPVRQGGGGGGLPDGAKLGPSPGRSRA